MRTLFLLFMIMAVGCSNSVDKVEGLPNIKISGLVLNGNVRDASVQVVGIDNYGQPQRNSAGEIYADRFFTNDNGRYNLEINPVVTGSLLFIVTAHNEDGHNMQIRCALKNGCLNEQGSSVSFGDWYDASADFELWAAVNDPATLTDVHVSPLTHLAAKLAYSDFVSDGTCSSDADCEGVKAVNGLFTSQTIHEANTRVKALFNSAADIHGFIEPFSPFNDTNLDTTLAVDGAKHGLLNLTLQYQAREENKTLSTVLDDWLNGAFFKNKGQLYGDDQTNTPAQWSLKTAFENSIAVNNELALPNNSALVAAAAEFQLIAADLTNTITNVKGSDYSDDLATQITQAKQFVSNAQSWVADYETKTFGNFLDDDTAAETTSMEAQWEAFQKTLGPELQSVLLPMVQLVDYALICSANGNCASGTSYAFSDASASVAFASADNRFTYTTSAQTNTFVQGDLLNSSDSGLIKAFTFSQDINVESSTGLAIVQSRTDNKASIKVYLDSTLQSGIAPAIRRIEFDFPKLTLKAKVAEGGSAFQNLVYTADDVTLAMQGVKEPTRTNMPIHFNLESLSLLGQVSNGSDVLDVDVTLNGSNASLHYPAQRFPDLEFVWKGSDIKKFAQFDSSGLANANLAGWLALPSDVVLGETLAGAVAYNEQAQFSLLPQALKTAIKLTEFDQFEFGELRYPGGATGLVVYKGVGETTQKVKQCNESEEVWSCSDAVALADLGCQSPFSKDPSFSNNASVADGFLFLKNNVDAQNVGCIPEVKIVGRGVYDINYGDITGFNDGDNFSVTLDEPHYLGLSSFNIRLLSRFKDGANQLDETPVLLSILGALTDPDNVSIAFSVTHDFIGFADSSSLGLIELLPYGERSLWFSIGTSDQASQSTVVYRILDDTISLIMTGIDFSDQSSGFHDEPIGFIRYANKLVGSLRKEGELYVVRYIDGSWQLL